MHTLTLNSKGQLTIPSKTRKRLKWAPGSKIKLYIEPQRDAVVLKSESSIKDAFGMLPKPKKVISIEEMNEGVKQYVANQNKLP